VSSESYHHRSNPADIRVQKEAQNHICQTLKIKIFGLRFERYTRLTNTPSVVGQQIPAKPMELQAEFAEQDASTTTSPSQQFTIGIRIKQRNSKDK
jgi:hypothetical protein